MEGGQIELVADHVGGVAVLEAPGEYGGGLQGQMEAIVEDGVGRRDRGSVHGGAVV